MHLESKRKISKCVISEIVDFAANIASAGLRKHNIVDDQVASITQTFGSKHRRSKFYEENLVAFFDGVRLMVMHLAHKSVYILRGLY